MEITLNFYLSFKVKNINIAKNNKNNKQKPPKNIKNWENVCVHFIIFKFSSM